MSESETAPTTEPVADEPTTEAAGEAAPNLLSAVLTEGQQGSLADIRRSWRAKLAGSRAGLHTVGLLLDLFDALEGFTFTGEEGALAPTSDEELELLRRHLDEARAERDELQEALDAAQAALAELRAKADEPDPASGTAADQTSGVPADS